MLVLLLLLPPATTIETAWTSDTVGNGPVSGEMTYKMFVTSKDAGKGFTIIAPMSHEVYLVNDRGFTVHTWQSDNPTQGTVELLEDGTLIRGVGGSVGQSPGIQLLDWDGRVLWNYTPPKKYVWHHDVERMPNGNYLINTIVTYKRDQAAELGRSPEITPVSFCVEPILEIKPNGTSGGDIVWMWDPTDHLIQNYSSEKPNFGVVTDHPELININVPPENVTDWQHSNSVSYNPELDQVMITNRNIEELWVIDHNTTMEEAAGHSGGAHGRGGDLLYRWGNAQAYGAGNSTNHVLYGPHDAHWIRPGLPGAGNIIIFNNGENGMSQQRPEGIFTTIEEMAPPLNSTGGYDLAPGSAFGPSDVVWCYNASPPTSFFAGTMGGAERLPNGNTLVGGGSTGYVFETTPENEIVWDYKSDALFRASRYYPPAIDIAPFLNATEDVMLRLNLSSTVSDPDTDHGDLMVGAKSPFVEVIGLEARLLYPEGVMTDVVNLSVSDGIFKVAMEVRVNITPVNDPPILAPMPSINVTEDVPYLLDVLPYISDPDTNVTHMGITVNSSFVEVQGGRLRFLYPDGVLTDRVLLSVSDGEFSDRTDIFVNVTPVNDPPSVDPIPDQHVVEDVPWTVDLAPYIDDIDTPIQGLSVSSVSPYAVVSGLGLSLLYPEGVTIDVVPLNVSDGEWNITAMFNVTVEPVNDTPAFKTLPHVNVTEDEPLTLDLGPFVSDVDTPLERLVLRVVSPYVTVDGHGLTLLYPDGVLHDELVVHLSDGQLEASATLVVDVVPVNDPPTFWVLLPVTVTEDVPFALDLGPLVSDVDTPPEGLALRVESHYVTANGLALTLLYPDGVLGETVEVEVWDGQYTAASTLVVTVVPVNDPPWWSHIPDVVAVEDIEAQFTLDPYINDVDTPFGQLVVTAASSYGSVVGHVFRFTYPEGVLRETVTLTLTDGEYSAVVRFNVTVTPVNDAPTLSGAGVSPPRGRAGTPLNFTVVFKDVDMGSHAPVVEVVIDGVGYPCVGAGPGPGGYDGGVVYFLEKDLGPGTHIFHFTADDGDGGTVSTEDLMVTVKKGQDGTGLTTIMIAMLIIGAAVLIAVLRMRWGKSSGPPV